MKNLWLSGLSSLLLPLSAYAGVGAGAGYQRTYLSAASAAAAADLSQIRVLPRDLIDLSATQGEPLDIQVSHAVRELVIVDESVAEADKAVLSRALKPDVQMVYINSAKAGLPQLIAALRGYKNLAAIHVISHAEAGVILLGNSRITVENIQREEQAFAALHGAMREGGDLLFYGCNLAASKAGEDLLDIISHNTGLDVAASNNLTGNPANDGDWELEVKRGKFEPNPSFSGKSLKDFSSVLVPSNGMKDFTSGWTDNNSNLTSTDFIVKGYDSGGSPISNLSFVIPGYANAAYLQTGYNGTTTGTYFHVAADGTNTGSFELTGLVAGEAPALGGQFTNVHIIGIKPDNSTITSSTINGTGGAVDTFTFGAGQLTSFSGVKLKAFKLVFDTTSGSGTKPFFEFRNFTITGALAPLPVVSDSRISISGASGTGGAYKIGDTITAAWNNTAGGDNNTGINGVTMDFSEFEGGTAVVASDSSNTWTATYTITAGATDSTNRNVSVKASNGAGNTTTADTTNTTVDNVAPTVTDGGISISGASGTGGAFKIGDTVTATWNNTAGGDNNSDTISAVTVNFSDFGGGAAVSATNSSGTWTATYTVVAGAIDNTNRNITVTATDNAGNATSTADTSNATVDNIAPVVSSSTPAGGAISTATSVDFTVNFGESVSNITLDDFALGTTGSATGTISGVSANSGSSVTVTVSSISGNGTIKLNLNASTDISDAAGNSGPAAYTSGTTHTVAIPTAPDAPTIGVATAGDGQVSVAFTAPGNNGGSAITGYTVTSSPSSISAGGNGFTTSPITVSGLTNGTAYTFTVTATNAIGTSTASASSNSATPKADQTITFADPGAQVFGTSPTLSATASSTLTVAFTSSTTGVCTITSGGALTFVTAGSCTIHADQAGNSAFNAAPQVSHTFNVTAVAPAAPTIGTATAGNTNASVTFSAPGNTGGAAITSYTVTSSPSGLTGTGAASPITVNGLSNGVAYTFTVTATSTGGTSVASAASNAVTPAAPQTITFNNPNAQNFGTSPTLTASSSAGGAYVVTFTSATTGVCTVTSGGVLTFVTAGTCTINADQAGDSSFLPAPQVSQSFMVNAVLAGAPTAVTATAGNTQASIAFTAPASNGGSNITGYIVTTNPAHVAPLSVAGSPATVSGLTNSQAYTFTVQAVNGVGDGPASAASNSITPKALQTITFNDPGAQNFGTTPTLTATASSTLPVTFTSSTTSVCTVTSGGALTFVTTGTCTIKADQAGNGSYLAATQVSRSFTVNAVVPGAPVIGTATVTGATSVSLTFTAPVSNGGAAITGYTINRTPAGSPLTVAGSPATISGLTTGQSYTFTVTATNSAGTGGASAASNAVVPRSLNTAPLISGSPGTSATAGVAYSFAPTATDADAGTTLTFSASGVPGWASFSSSSGAISGTPAETDVGSSGSIVISVSDGEATASLPAFSITVQSGNKAPQISGSPATTVKAGAAYSFTPTASDPNAADKLTFSISNKPGWASFDSSNGSLSGTPAQTDAGTTSGIVISVSDGKLSASLAAFSLQVIGNTAPVASAGSSTLNEDEPASFVLGGTDVDGDTLTVQVQSGPAHGSVSQSGDAWLYTPNKDYNGPDSLSFVVKDASLTSAAATYSFSVTAVNDAPQAVDDVLTQARSSNDQYGLSVLGNDKDVDGDTLTLAGATASVGSVTVSGNSLNYTAPAQYTGPVELRYSVSDGKKGLATAAVSLTITGTANDQLPVITVPADIEINATALYTRVQLGTATAVDKDGRRLRVSLVNGSLFFAPGHHKVYWQATDANNNTATKMQQVRVNPLVSLSKDQVVSEGSSVSVEVKLNGPAAQYPVQVPYTVSGTAGGNDHTLSSGTVEISSGESGMLQFDVLEDAVVDSGETIVIALSGVNAGSQRSTTIRITETNVAPVLSLSSSQQGENRLTLSRTDGVVTLSALATDANATDVVSLVWQSSLPLAGSNANSRTFNPSTVEPGVYPVTVTATDNGSPVKSATAQLYLVVQPSLPVLGSTDTDGDLIPDNLEGFADEDRDGLPDYKDRSSECNVVPEADTEQQAFLVEGEPGACLRRGQQSIVASSGGLQLAVNELELDTSARNIGGVFDFIAYNLPQAGQGYQVSFPQAEPIPTGAVYRKYSSSKGWVDFIIDSKNTVRSAPGERGFCPPPGDAAYTPGLTAGHWCVQVVVEDGGPNDADGIANAAIVDPGGVAVPVSSNQLPVAKADTATTRMNQAVVVKVLANDTDADNDTLSVSQAVANFGTVSIGTDGALTYTPAKDYVGTDVVVYSIADGKGGTASSELTVTVRLNNAPIAAADTAATDDRTAISINVLGNDTDADNDPLKVISASALTGTVTIDSDNRLRYTPKAGFNGADTISYRISDGFGGEASGQVTVTVTAYQTVTVNNKSSGGAGSGLWLAALALLAIVRRYGLLLVLPCSGFAQAGDWQVQLGAGQSKADQTQEKLQITVPPGSIGPVDDSDTALSLSVQYQWFERFDLELGYQSFGEAGVTLSATTLTPAQYHQAVQSLTPVLGDGVYGGARIGLWQQYGWRLQLPLGMIAWQSDIESSLNGTTLRSDMDGTDIYYGLALQYLHDAHWSAGIAWQQFALAPENVRVIQLTASYRF